MNRFIIRALAAMALATTAAVASAVPAAAFYEGIKPEPQIPAQSSSIAVDPSGGGYWTMIDQQGIGAHDGAPFFGTVPKPKNQSFGTIVASPDGEGYWAVENLGGGAVHAFGGAAALPSFDTTGYQRYDTYLTDVTATADGKSLFGVDWVGHVWSVGPQKPLGDVAGRLKGPAAVAIRMTPTGAGYYIVGANGNVWTFGDAVYHGHLNPDQTRIITSMAVTTSGAGYWLVDQKGLVTPFGDAARQSGTLTDTGSAVTSMAARADGAGYYLLHENGVVDTFGPVSGRPGGNPPGRHCGWHCCR